MRGSFDFARKIFQINFAVEVGVYDGANAEDMMRHGVGFLYLVDPYKAHLNHGMDKDLPTYQVTQEEMRLAKALTISRLNPWSGKFELMEMTSEAAANALPNCLDYVYIDAIHSYEAVKKDIALWWPKVRSGGVLGGHDYVLPQKDGRIGYAGVVRAVNEFANANGLALGTGGADWWVVKP